MTNHGDCPLCEKRKRITWGLSPVILTKEDVSLMAILADVDEVLIRHSADTAQVVAAGQQLIYTAFGTRLRVSESRRKPRFQYAEREQARP